MKSAYAVLLLSVACGLTIGPAYADGIDFDTCAHNKDHHCYEYAPVTHRIPTSQGLNEQFNAYLPDGTCNITGAQIVGGGCSVPAIIMSQDNWTKVQTNPTVMSIRDIQQTGSPTNTNYCPFGLYTITHQDGYLNMTYDVNKSLDLTPLAYPAACIAETGPNPIDHMSQVPEFPEIAVLMVMGTAITFSIIASRRRHS